MGRILLTTGEYAEIPYCFENLGIRVYSAEELCYVLKENAFLLDTDLLNKKLVRWIDESLHLHELAKALYPLINKKAAVAVFAETILRYVGFYDEETIARIEEIYQNGTDLNFYEKLKSKVDYMAAAGRFAPAVSEYEALIEELPQEEKVLRAKLLHNKGVALCGLFFFKEAEKVFEEAYALLPDPEILTEYLAAKRMSMGEGEYVAFAAGHPDYYEETMELESRVKQLVQEWELSAEKRRLDERAVYKEQGDMAAYYEVTEEWVRKLKNEYRNHTGSIVN